MNVPLIPRAARRVSVRHRVSAHSASYPYYEGDSIRIVEMPDLGAVSDSSAIVGERAGSGLFLATALVNYIANSASGPLVTLPSIAALRANTKTKGASNPFYVSAYATLGDGGEGMFIRATADTTSADNGGTIIVDACGQRWYRQTGADTSLSVRWFGARGDGTTNDSPAFAAAVAVADASGGGRIYIPEGQYRLNATVVACASNVSFEGDGVSSVILNGQADKAALELGDGVVITYNYRVSGLSFATASGVVSASGNVGLRARKIGQSNFDDLVFTRYPAANYDGMSLESVSQSTINAIFSQDAKRHGIYLISCIDLYITSSRSDANQYGINFTDCAGCYCANVACYNNATNAFWINYGTSGNHDMFFANCVGDTSGASNWLMASICRSTFVNCWGSTQRAAATNPTAGGFDIVGSGCYDLTFSAGMAMYNNGSGVHLINSGGTAPSYIVFNGMIFGSQGLGNGIAGAGYGLAIDGGCAHIKVIGGIMRDNVSAAIRNDATTDIEVSGVAGCVTRNAGQATLPSANTSVVVNHGLSLQPSGADIIISPASLMGSAKTLYVDTVTSTSFTVRSDVAPGSVSPLVNWSAAWVR
jgi:hypothetical protein